MPFLFFSVAQGAAVAGGSQTLAATLDGVTVAVAQAAQHPQSLAATLDGVTVAASQTAQHPQSMTATLADITAAVSDFANDSAVPLLPDEFHYLVSMAGLEEQQGLVLKTKFGSTAIDSLITPLNF